MQNMDQKSYNSKEREPEIAAKQQLLEQLENHVKYLREVNKTLVKIERDMQEMDEYYYGEWLNDYNNFNTENSYNVLSQDHIYDALQEIYIEKIKILKKIANKLK